MKYVLIACEESQAVCKAFREQGAEAYSLDLQECSGGHPEWHIRDFAEQYLAGRRYFKTCDGVILEFGERGGGRLFALRKQPALHPVPPRGSRCAPLSFP